MYVVAGVLSVMLSLISASVLVSGVGLGVILDSLQFPVLKLVDTCVGVLLGASEVLFLSLNDLSAVLGGTVHCGKVVVVLDCFLTLDCVRKIFLIDVGLVVGVVMISVSFIVVRCAEFHVGEVVGFHVVVFPLDVVMIIGLSVLISGKDVVVMVFVHFLIGSLVGLRVSGVVSASMLSLLSSTSMACLAQMSSGSEHIVMPFFKRNL